MKPQTSIAWPQFLARHDLLWTSTPTDLNSAPWFGNGLIGSMLWQEGDRLRLQVFRNDVEDYRSFDYGYVGYTRSRLQIGSFYWQPKGKITGCNLRLHLHDATLRGTISTTAGKIEIEHFVHAEDHLIVTELKCSDEERLGEWIWEPATAEPTRPRVPTTPELVADYAKEYGIEKIVKQWQSNPPPIIEVGVVSTSTQKLDHGAEHSVAWQQKDGRLIVSIGKNYPTENVWFNAQAGTGREQALQVLESKLQESRTSDWRSIHTTWWSNYYERSFLSVPSPRVETVYWIQMYKLGSATRADRPMIDTAGIWQTPSTWPYITWNLNVQLCYIPCYTAGRFDIAESLIRTLWNCRENLRNNVRPVEWQSDSYWLGLATGSDLDHPYDIDGRNLHQNAGGNLIWALHCVWLHCRHSMDASLTTDRLFPLLRGAVSYVLHLLHEGEDGLLHLPTTMSPEFGETKDATYDLALLRWGLQALIEISERHNLQDPQVDEWRVTLTKLPDYTTDTNGYAIGANTSFDKAHRHFSHLMQIYPLYLVTDDQNQRGLIEKSIRHFYEINQKEYERTGHWDGFAAYTYTGLSSLSSAIGHGNDSLRFLNGFIDYDLVRPNSLYGEMGPCMESPLSAAQCVHDMLLQSWGGKIRLFPAMPDDWTDAVFHQLTAQGGFEVSARWKNSQLDWASITSKAGEPCVVTTALPESAELHIDGVVTTAVRDESGSIIIPLRAGETLVICHPGAELSVAPLPSDQRQQHWYGLNENRSRLQQQATIKA